MSVDGSVFVSLMRHHLSSDEYLSWVPAYKKVRWSPREHASVIEHVGGHFRRQPFCAQTDAVLARVCKHDIVHTPFVKRRRLTYNTP